MNSTNPKIIEPRVPFSIIRDAIIAASDYTEQSNSMEVVEPQTQDSSSQGRTDFLVSFSTKVEIAKELVARCSSRHQSAPGNELQSTIRQLEEVITSMAEDFSNVSLSDYQTHGFAEIGLDDFSPSLDISQSDHVERQQGGNGYENFVKEMYDRMRRNEDSNVLPRLAEILQPAYQGFFCPLTKKIMDDPVTIESGITYEKEAILEWFEMCSNNVVCPSTRMEIKSVGFSSNLALKHSIKEWKDRNETTRIRIARSALSLAISEAMLLDAIKELQVLSQLRRCNREHMHNAGITQQVTQFLRHESTNVRCEVMQLLRLLVEDEAGKVIVANTRVRALTRTIKMISSYNSSERHAAVSFLLELSKSEMFLDRIGGTPGGILILITMKYNKEADPFSASKAEETLKNLEKSPMNIRCMAENGFVEPLLNHLIDGSEEVKMEMVSYLGGILLEDEMKTYVAERASAILIQMIDDGDTRIRKVALRALVQISAHPPNCKILVDAGIMQTVVEEILPSRLINGEPLDSPEEAAAILANMLESDAEGLSEMKVSETGHTVFSHYFIYRIAQLLKISMPEEANANLVRILLSLAKLPDAIGTVVSAIMEIGAIQTIVEFLNSELEELAVVAAKLLIALSPHAGHAISTGLCKMIGQPEGLIVGYTAEQITERQAVSANLIAKLPSQSTPLNRFLLLLQGTVPVILARIQELQRGEVRGSGGSSSSSRIMGHYLEGLVGILVKFAGSLLDQEILEMALSRNFTSVFADLLVRAGGSSEVQRLAAVGLEKLSLQSVKLAKPPPAEARRRSIRPVSFFSKSTSGSEGRTASICPAHRGVCSATTTFCLLESGAAERLLVCLENEDAKVVEAALSAISTLLEESVDVEGSVQALSQLGAIRSVLGVLKVHGREEGVLQRVLWLVDRLLEKGKEKEQWSREIYNDKLLRTVLVSVFHRGEYGNGNSNSNNKRIAENILRHMQRILSNSTYNLGM